MPLHRWFCRPGTMERIEDSLTRIERMLIAMASTEQQLADDLNKIQAGVTAAIADIQSLTDQIAALKAQPSPVTQAQLDTLTAQADSIVTALGSFTQ